MLDVAFFAASDPVSAQMAAGRASGSVLALRILVAIVSASSVMLMRLASDGSDFDIFFDPSRNDITRVAAPSITVVIELGRDIACQFQMLFLVFAHRDLCGTYSFSGEIFDWMISTGRWPLEHVQRFVTYPFVHATFTHALFAGVMLLALGKMVAEAFGAVATLAIWLVSSIGGAFVYALLSDTGVPLIGAFPPIYGLIGAFTYLLWLRLGQMGEQQLRAFSLIGILLGIQLLFGLFFGGGKDWLADIGGFVSGFGLSLFLVPGGWARILAKLRGE
ncbi:hypothetical protein GQR58_000266 [Nymphon striatum]|nr:hypothetical protein GQR58_000266 [Nymphon striatum]